MAPRKNRPEGVPANWSAWKLTNAEQAPCHMLFPLACEVRLREYVEEFESSFEGTEEDKKDRTLLRVSESPFAGCGEEVSLRKEVAMKMEKAKEATARKAEKARIESFASDPRPPPDGKQKKIDDKVTGDDANLEYYQAVQEDIRVILNHLGPNFCSQPALAIAGKNEEGKGGVQEPWSQEQAGKAIGNQGSSRKRVELLADYLFSGQDGYPAFVKKLLEVQVPRMEKMPVQPSALVMISPDEYAHAILAGAARTLPQHKERWSIVLRSVPCCFSTTADEELWIAAWNNRNEIAQEYESLSRSALQTATEVTLLKERADKDMCRTLKNEEFADWGEPACGKQAHNKT